MDAKQTKMTNYFKPVNSTAARNIARSVSVSITSKTSKSKKKEPEVFNCFSNIFSRRGGKRKTTSTSVSSESSSEKKPKMIFKESAVSQSDEIPEKYKDFFSKGSSTSPGAQVILKLENDEKPHVQIQTTKKPDFGKCVLNGGD